jgi:hypothetical protein
MMNWKIWKETGLTCFKVSSQELTTKPEESSESLTPNCYLHGRDLKL